MGGSMGGSMTISGDIFFSMKSFIFSSKKKQLSKIELNSSMCSFKSLKV